MCEAMGGCSVCSLFIVVFASTADVCVLSALHPLFTSVDGCRHGESVCMWLIVVYVCNAKGWSEFMQDL